MKPEEKNKHLQEDLSKSYVHEREKPTTNPSTERVKSVDNEELKPPIIINQDILATMSDREKRILFANQLIFITNQLIFIANQLAILEGASFTEQKPTPPPSPPFPPERTEKNSLF